MLSDQKPGPLAQQLERVDLDRRVQQVAAQDRLRQNMVQRGLVRPGPLCGEQAGSPGGGATRSEGSLKQRAASGFHRGFLSCNSS